RGKRRLLAARSHLRRGRDRQARDDRHARRAVRVRAGAGNAARRRPRAPRQGNAGSARVRPGRPPGARQRRHPDATHRRAATTARAVRDAERRTDLPARRGVLLEAEERVSLRRVSVEVPLARAEEARATFVELFPGGFEEIDRDGAVELVAYTDGA